MTRGDRTLAKQQLQLYQRENIAWERDTVWRQMIAQERRGQDEDEPTAIASLLKKPGPGLFYIRTPLGRIRVTRKMLWKIVAGVVFVLLLNMNIVVGVEANRCFAILMFCTILWASEVSTLVFDAQDAVLMRVWACFRLYHYSPRQRSCHYCWYFCGLFVMTKATRKASQCLHLMLQCTFQLLSKCYVLANRSC